MPKNNFNPIKEEQSGAQAKRVVWSSASLDLALAGLEQGRKLIANPFYENNTKLLKGDLVFQRTDEEIQEWIKCKKDIIYFVEKYCKLMTPEGIKNVTLRKYQRKYLKHLEQNRLSIYLACRQCGKTTTSAVFMLHYILFNSDKNALVLGNKRKTAVEILDKAKKIYYELPYFLRPGIYKWNEAEIVLDNGCRLMAEATTINSGISFTFHCVLADEFAHIAPNIIDKFYNNLFPTITAGKARFMITSTQNGYNLFYRLYMAAEAGINEYAAFKTDWDEVPEWNPEKKRWEVRDETWHKLQVANYGSEEAFNAQFGTNFDISANTLISQKILRNKKLEVINFEEKDLYGVPLFNYYKWNPNFDPMEDLKKSFVVITVDLAEGTGGDNTIFMINIMKDPTSSSKLECIGYFKSNQITRSLCTHSLQTLICLYCNQEHTLLSHEKNTYGDLFYKDLWDNISKDPIISNKFDPSILVKYYSEKSTTYTYGIKITPGNKTTHCILFKEAYERDNFICDDVSFVNELSNFSDDGNNKFKASFGHDDMVMAAIQLEFVKNTLQYTIMRDEFITSSSVKIQSEELWDPYSNSYSELQLMDDYYISDTVRRLGGYVIKQNIN